MTRAICGRKPALTVDQARALHEWAAFGTSAREVARNLGISRRTLTDYLRGRHKRPEYVEARSERLATLEG